MTLRIPNSEFQKNPEKFKLFIPNERFHTHVKIYRLHRAPSRPNCRGCHDVWTPDGPLWALGYFCSGGSGVIPECNRLAWPPREPGRRTRCSWWCPPKIQIQNAKFNGHRPLNYACVIESRVLWSNRLWLGTAILKSVK